MSNANNNKEIRNRSMFLDILREPGKVYLMARKPCSLRDLQEQVNKEISLTELKKMVGGSKIITTSFNNWGDLEQANLSENQWWKITLEKEQVELLIDTQGYEYPRYAGIIKK